MLGGISSYIGGTGYDQHAPAASGPPACDATNQIEEVDMREPLSFEKIWMYILTINRE